MESFKNLLLVKMFLLFIEQDVRAALWPLTHSVQLTAYPPKKGEIIISCYEKSTSNN
jgi:hypothetical protein